MSVPVDELRSALHGKSLPGGELRIDDYEAAIAEGAWHGDPPADPGEAHPMWFIVASLRCMGISVAELCELAHQESSDTLLFGTCTVVQDRPLLVGSTYAARATITEVNSRTARDGTRLDAIEIAVSLSTESGDAVGSVTSEYLFKRGGEA
jgi:hypothetical protein